MGFCKDVGLAFGPFFLPSFRGSGFCIQNVSLSHPDCLPEGVCYRGRSGGVAVQPMPLDRFPVISLRSTVTFLFCSFSLSLFFSLSFFHGSKRWPGISLRYRQGPWNSHENVNATLFPICSCSIITAMGHPHTSARPSQADHSSTSVGWHLWISKLAV